MKRKKLLLATIVAVVMITGGIIYAADHIDTPTVTNQPADITDVYVFRGADPANLVFVANSQGLTSPANSAALKFDENTVLEFNIDKTGRNSALPELQISFISFNSFRSCIIVD